MNMVTRVQKLSIGNQHYDQYGKLCTLPSPEAMNVILKAQIEREYSKLAPRKTGLAMKRGLTKERVI